jgi:glucose 1-dehydrogenase
MKAITVEPRKPESARLENISEPDARRACPRGSHRGRRVRDRRRDRRGRVRLAPQSKARLVLGYESLGRVVDPGPNSSLKEGDLVVGIVRRPRPSAMLQLRGRRVGLCRNGQYAERGIKEIDGFMSERWRVEPEYAVKVDPSLGLLGVLLEPTTVVA